MTAPIQRSTVNGGFIDDGAELPERTQDAKGKRNFVPLPAQGELLPRRIRAPAAAMAPRLGSPPFAQDAGNRVHRGRGWAGEDPPQPKAELHTQRALVTGRKQLPFPGGRGLAYPLAAPAMYPPRAVYPQQRAEPAILPHAFYPPRPAQPFPAGRAEIYPPLGAAMYPPAAPFQQQPTEPWGMAVPVGAYPPARLVMYPPVVPFKPQPAAFHQQAVYPPPRAEQVDAYPPAKPALYPPVGPFQQQWLQPAAYAPGAPSPFEQAFPGNGFSPAMGAAPVLEDLYAQVNLPMTPETLPAFIATDVIKPPKRLGAGAFNTVYSVQLKNPDGGEFNAVFKPLQKEENGWVAEKTGIPKDDPQIALRNLATVAYAQRLGFNVIAETKIAVINPTPGSGKPQLGLAMEAAPGTPASKTDPEILCRPDVYAEVVSLQLLDHLTGQGDRHSGNYFVSVENGRAKVTGIDNDQCFGKNLKDPNGIQFAKTKDAEGFRGTLMPPIVDMETAHRIRSLRPSDLYNMLCDKLDKQEIAAAIERLNSVKSHIALLDMQGRLIHPCQWSNKAVQAEFNSKSSYIGRELSSASNQW